jgi:hypothetical protein
MVLVNAIYGKWLWASGELFLFYWCGVVSIFLKGKPLYCSERSELGLGWFSKGCGGDEVGPMVAVGPVAV